MITDIRGRPTGIIEIRGDNISLNIKNPTHNLLKTISLKITRPDTGLMQVNELNGEKLMKDITFNMADISDNFSHLIMHLGGVMAIIQGKKPREILLGDGTLEEFKEPYKDLFNKGQMNLSPELVNDIHLALFNHPIVLQLLQKK